MYLTYFNALGKYIAEETMTAPARLTNQEIIRRVKKKRKKDGRTGCAVMVEMPIERTSLPRLLYPDRSWHKGQDTNGTQEPNEATTQIH